MEGVLCDATKDWVVVNLGIVGFMFWKGDQNRSTSILYLMISLSEAVVQDCIVRAINSRVGI